ncbi:hypothetical protein HDU76_005901, partial [Blyttiomyces sp. JEL0837]
DSEEAVKVCELKASADISIKNGVGVIEILPEVEEVSTVTEAVDETSLGVASAYGNVAEAKEVVDFMRWDAASDINSGLSQEVVLEHQVNLNSSANTSLHKILPIALEDDEVTTVNEDGTNIKAFAKTDVTVASDTETIGENSNADLTSPKAETDKTSTCDTIVIDKIPEIDRSGNVATVTEMDKLCEHEATPVKDEEAKEILYAEKVIPMTRVIATQIILATTEKLVKPTVGNENAKALKLDGVFVQVNNECEIAFHDVVRSTIEREVNEMQEAGRNPKPLANSQLEVVDTAQNVETVDTVGVNSSSCYHQSPPKIYTDPALTEGVTKCELDKGSITSISNAVKERDECRSDMAAIALRTENSMTDEIKLDIVDTSENAVVGHDIKDDENGLTTDVISGIAREESESDPNGVVTSLEDGAGTFDLVDGSEQVETVGSVPDKNAKRSKNVKNFFKRLGENVKSGMKSFAKWCVRLGSCFGQVDDELDDEL